MHLIIKDALANCQSKQQILIDIGKNTPRYTNSLRDRIGNNWTERATELALDSSLSQVNFAQPLAFPSLPIKLWVRRARKGRQPFGKLLSSTIAFVIICHLFAVTLVWGMVQRANIVTFSFK